MGNSKKIINASNAAYFLLLVGFIFSLDGLLSKISTASGLSLVVYRSGISFLILSYYLKFPKIRFSLKEFLTALCLALTCICFFAAIKLTSVSNVIFIYATSPIFAGIWGRIFLKEKFKKADFILIPTTIFGITLLLIEGISFDSYLGNFLSLLTAIFYSLYALGMKIQNEENPLHSVQLAHLICFLLLLPFVYGTTVNLTDSLIILLLAVFSGAISFIIFVEAIKYVSTLESLLIPSVETVLTPFWVFLFLGEIPSLLAIIGGIIVISSISIKSYLIASAA